MNKDLEILLENYWVSKEQDKELYYRLKDSIPKFKSFLNDKLGYHVIINSYMIKLEKLPGKSESWMGISEFDSVMEYGFLCLLLVFLEGKGNEEQFVLSQITEFIQLAYPGDDKVDWTLFKHRRYLIKVMRFASEIGMIRVNDGDEQTFASDAASEVLYESTGMSRYFTRNFSMNILNFNSYKDIENEDFMEIDRDRGIIRRQRVYRRVLMSPVVYNNGADDADYAYIKHFRNLIEKDMEAYLGLSFHVHRNGAMLVLDQTNNFGQTFPENKAISDIVLQMNFLLRDQIEEGNLVLKSDDTVMISIAAFQSYVISLKGQNVSGWSKEFREMDALTLAHQILAYMKSYNMVELTSDQKEVKIMPLVGKISGGYPEHFNAEEV